MWLKLDDLRELDGMYRERLAHYNTIRVLPGVERIRKQLEMDYLEKVVDMYRKENHMVELADALLWYGHYNGWLK